MRVGAYSHFGEEYIGQDTQQFVSYAGVINVHDPSGKPIHDARITLVRKSTMEPYGQVRTDANGLARIVTQVPNSTAGLAYRIDKNDAEGMIDPLLVDVAPGKGEQAQGVTVTLKAPGGSVAGKALPIAAIGGGILIVAILGYFLFKK